MMQPVGRVYATLNPSDKSPTITLSGNNLVALCSTSASKVRSTIGKSSGKWYWEYTVSVATGPIAGIAKSSAPLTTYTGAEVSSWSFYSISQKYNNATATTYGLNYNAGDVIGVALDMSGGTITFLKNGVSLGVAFSGLTGVLYASLGNSGATTPTITVNFGATSFVYAPPTGFNAGLYE